MQRHKNCRHGHGSTPGQGTRGGKSSSEYVSWSAMKSRCRNPENKSYADYGGAGIAVCEQWLVFDNFLLDVGRKPSPAHQIERVDNSKGYEPGNCRWATPTEQANNRRSSKYFSYNEKTQTMAQWAREVGLKKSTLFYRLSVSGWSFEKAISTPLRGA